MPHITARELLTSPRLFSRYALRRPLRRYQLPIAEAVLASALGGLGRTFAVMMSRQAGKNEVSAHIEAQLMTIFQRQGGFIVKAAPTYRPQAQNSSLRLLSTLRRSGASPTREGHIVRLGNARAVFLSAALASNVVGATANILLECDEAQDVDPQKWAKEFRPMAASANTTTVLYGTPWTSDTLLARTIASLQLTDPSAVFLADWETVSAEVPAYQRYVLAEIARQGYDHPLTLTQYRLQTIDAEAGMFTSAVQSMMRGDHPRQLTPELGRAYVFLLDVAGASESDADPTHLLGAQDARRDATALTIVELTYNAAGQAVYRVINRQLWIGYRHTEIYPAILKLAHDWGPARLVVDATGIGTGLTSFLTQALGERVWPFVFTSKSKSDLGWTFLSLCHSGRFLDHIRDGSPEQEQFWREVAACRYEVLPGPGHLLRWNVPDPTIHDDALISAALVAALEAEPFGIAGPSWIVEADDTV